MKVYLASSFALTERVKDVAVGLESAGHEITRNWWEEEACYIRALKDDWKHPNVWYGEPIVKIIYERDMIAVRKADALVIVAGETPRAFNGANVEYGYFLALGKPCFSVGWLENSAMYFPVHRCYTVNELVSALEDVVIL